MTEYWCELAWLGGPVATADVLLRVDGDRLTAVESGAPCPASAVRLAGLTMPGMANAHSHAFHRALRGRTQTGVGTFWTWRDQMYRAAVRLDPDSYFRLARAVYGEMVLAGITCVGEFHYLHHGVTGTPYADPNAMGAALIAAAAEAGVRITLLDACYLRGGLASDGSTTALNDVQQRFGDASGDAWATRTSALRALSSASCCVGAAIHSVRTVEPDDISIVVAWAAANETPLHAHVSEQPAENEQCVEAYGLTPTALLAERGVLSPRFSAIHATHLSGVDIDLYGTSDCTICMCPTTERDLADGIGPARALRDAGARLSLGSDSHAVIDMFEEARAVELNERLASQVRGRHDAQSLLLAATAQGHFSLGWHTAGRLEAGALADFVSVRLDTVRTAGADPTSVLEMAVFGASAADVHHVVVGGKVVVSEGVHASLDVAGDLVAAIAAVTGE